MWFEAQSKLLWGFAFHFEYIYTGGESIRQMSSGMDIFLFHSELSEWSDKNDSTQMLLVIGKNSYFKYILAFTAQCKYTFKVHISCIHEKYTFNYVCFFKHAKYTTSIDMAISFKICSTSGKGSAVGKISRPIHSVANFGTREIQ